MEEDKNRSGNISPCRRRARRRRWFDDDNSDKNDAGDEEQGMEEQQSKGLQVVCKKVIGSRILKDPEYPYFSLHNPFLCSRAGFT